MTEGRSGSSPHVATAGVLRALVRLAPLSITVFLQATWIKAAALSGDPRWLEGRDWHQFFVTGRRVVSGDLGSLYSRSFESGLFWLYPPYCIYLTVPLGLLPETLAYVACVAVQVAAVLAALALLRASLPAPGREHLTAAAVVLASMPFNTTVPIGQISGTLALILAASLWAWRREQSLATGLILALLFVKPNLALVFPALCVLTGQWRVVAGTAVGIGLLLLSTVPLGLERWTDYFHSMQGIVQANAPLWKEITLYAFWRTIPGLTAAPRLATLLWLGSALPLAAVTAAAWYRRWRPGTPVLPRLFGLAVLLVAAGSLHVYFYDGLLLLFPGIAWYVRRDEYGCRACHRVIGLCILLVFVVGHLTMFVLESSVAWTGPLLAIWLLAEGWDLLRLDTSDFTHLNRARH